MAHQHHLARIVVEPEKVDTQDEWGQVQAFIDNRVNHHGYELVSVSSSIIGQDFVTGKPRVAYLMAFRKEAA
jgi:hypothetical protein